MNRKRKGAFREYTEAFAVALLVALVLRALVIQAFRIPTGSMKDTLMVGDFLLVNKFIYGARTPDHIPITNIKIPSFRFPALKKPQRGDIIVFKYPLDENLDYIKRCIGLPGDTIEIRKSMVYVNGHYEGEMKIINKHVYDADEDCYLNYFKVRNVNGSEYVIRTRNGRHVHQANYGPVVVPEGHLFMLGDNRDNSQDSRFWGFMPEKNIVGKALIIYWSWDRTASLWDISGKIRWKRVLSIIQ